MPKQAPLRLVKRCRLYARRSEWKRIPHITRGIYILYMQRPQRLGKKVYEVFYIGVGGVAKKSNSGIRARIKSHNKTKDRWTHFSFFEVHDNVSREEILEIEGLFLRIFRHDRRVKLDNKQLGAPILWQLAQDSASVWRD